VTFSIQGAVDEARSWTWNEFTALPAEEVTGRHPLRHEVEQARDEMEKRLASSVRDVGPADRTGKPRS
jgi:hypothetical protein